ncbi:MAG: response regulator [Cyanobacteria bacterium P01_H01_bin.74]
MTLSSVHNANDFPGLPAIVLENESLNETEKNQFYTVLIVDDDDVIRDGLVSYLENFHEAPYQLRVFTSSHPSEAKALMMKQSIDLVITDINMPGEDGFSLIDHVQTHFSTTKTAMITAYKVDDYVRNAKKTGVFNIIAKTAPFDFEELSVVVNNLLQPETAFGLNRYLRSGHTMDCTVIKNSDDIMIVFNQLQSLLNSVKMPNVHDVLTALTEAITNAVYHVAKLPDGSLKYDKGQHIAALDESEYVYVYYGQDAERIGISVTDQGGRINAEEILFWLDRNISGAGLLDNHGRGVYLIHRLVDRMLINIMPGKRTEIILLHQINRELKKSTNKPIYINQL